MRIKVLSLLLAAVAVFAQTPSKRLTYTFELGTNPLNIDGMTDVEVSDWQRYGTGTVEGRMSLPLSESNTETPYGIGGSLGSNYLIADRVGVVLRVPFAYNAGAYFVGVATGLNFALVKNDDFSISIEPQVGYSYALLAPTQAEVLPGKTPPVITDNYTINEGDTLAGNSMGVFAEVDIVPTMAITPTFGLVAHLGYRYGLMGKPTISVNNTQKSKEINFSDPAIVQPTTTTPASFKGKLETSGPVVSVGAVFSL